MRSACLMPRTVLPAGPPDRHHHLLRAPGHMSKSTSVYQIINTNGAHPHLWLQGHLTDIITYRMPLPGEAAAVWRAAQGQGGRGGLEGVGGAAEEEEQQQQLLQGAMVMGGGGFGVADAAGGGAVGAGGGDAEPMEYST